MATSENQKTIPSLASLSRIVIAKKLERYPPDSFEMLSESEWESIVQCRYTMTTPKNTAAQKEKDIRILSGGRVHPAISAKHMETIEKANARFRNSKLTDELVWKDCVDYRFRKGGLTRPPIYNMPWLALLEKLRRIGDELVALSQPPPIELSKSPSFDATSESNRRTTTLLNIIHILEDTPMSVALLTESGIGKSLQKFVKTCYKIKKEYSIEELRDILFPDVWTQYHNDREYRAFKTECVPTSPLVSMENCLVGWRLMASGNVSNQDRKDSQLLRDYSGRCKNTSETQHQEDIERARKCTQWRHLYEALVEREAIMISHHGNRMRQIREDLKHDRPKVSKVSIRTTRKLLRQEEILSGQRGTNAGNVSSASSSCNKMRLLRKEVCVATKLQKSKIDSMNCKIKPTFGSSVASVAKKSDLQSKSKTALSSKRSAKSLKGITSNDISLGGGKRMRVPALEGKSRYGEHHPSSSQQEQNTALKKSLRNN